MLSCNDRREDEIRRASVPAADKLLALSEASDDMLRSILHQEYGEALAAIARHVHRLLTAESSAIFLVSEQRPGELELKASYTDNPDQKLQDPGPLPITSKPKGGLTSLVASEGKILRLHGQDLKNHPNVSGRPAVHLASGDCYSLLAIPVKGADGRACGVVKVDNKKGPNGKAGPDIEFDEDDVSIATILANKLSQILDSLRILTALRRSESLYQSLVEALPQMVSRKDTSGHITFASQSFCRLAGMSLDEIRGKTDYDLYPKALADAYRQDDRRVVEEGKPIHREERHQPPTGGEEIDVEVVKVPIFGPTGEISETQCIFWDITDRKRRELHLSALMETTRDHIYFKDRESRFLLINKALATRFGLKDPSDAIGKTDFDFFRNPHAQQAYDDEQQIIQTGNPISKEELETWADGSQSWVSTTKQCLRDRNGQITGTFGISRDITEQKLAHDRLDAVAKQREVLLALRSKLQSLPTIDQAYRLMLTLLTSGVGFQYNRSVLFLANLDGKYVGVCGIAPKDAAHFRDLGNAVAGWTIEQFIENFERHPAQYEWLLSSIKNISLSMQDGWPIHRAYVSRSACFGSQNVLPDPGFQPLQKALGFPAPYAVVPLCSGASCLGFIYLDNAFSGQPLGAPGTLSELGERLASVVNLLLTNSYRSRCSKALVQLITQAESLITSQEPDPSPLYNCLLEAADLVGARRACILTKQDQGEWQVASSSGSWPPEDTSWQVCFNNRGCEAVTTQGFVSLHPRIRAGTEYINLLSVVLPFSFGPLSYAICIEPYPGLLGQPELLEAISTLAAFGSAILAAAERSHLRATDARSFATNLMRMTAHESRNALNSVLWGLEDYEANRGKCSSKEAREFGLLKKRVNAGIEALTAYLELIKATEDEKNTEVAWTALSSVVLHVTNMIKPRIAKFGKSPDEVFKCASLDFEVKMNRTNLTIVLYNLVSNAVKAIRDIADPRIEVNSKLDSAHGLIEIKVIDNGCGITADQRKHLFTAGFSGFAQNELRKEGSAKALPRSSGVGLYSVKAIVEQQHGGKIRLNSISGRTEALVVLPGRAIV